MDIEGKKVGLDTNIFIYYFNASEEFGFKAKNIFSQLVANKSSAVTSIITLIELLSISSTDEEISFLNKLLLGIPNLKICDLGQNIGKEASRIRRKYGYSIPDSIQLATCIVEQADLFITNDKKLVTFRELRVLSI